MKDIEKRYECVFRTAKGSVNTFFGIPFVVGDATKVEIAQAVELAFPGRKVKKVQTVYMPSHEKRMGMKFGRTDSSKKAIVTVEGDPIEELTAI